MDFAGDIAGLTPAQADVLEALLRDAARDAPAVAPVPPKPVLIRQGSGDTPLVLVHGSGGRALFLHALARHLPATQTIYGLESATYRDVDASQICDAYVEALLSVQPRGPYRLGGYSAGCLIAFEMALRLQARGAAVEMLLFIDPVAVPGEEDDTSGEPSPAAISLQRRFEMAALAGVTPLSREFPYIERVNRVIAAVARGFKGRPFHGPIHVIHGTQGGYVPTPRVLQRWRDLAAGGLVCAALEADHFEIVRDPHAAATAGQIQHWLESLGGAGPADAG